MMKNSIVILLFLIAQFVSSQQKQISGKIIVTDATPGNVHVINATNETETITNNKGEFTILVEVDDLLIFSGEHLDYMRKLVEQEDFDAGTLTVEMTSKTIVLDEVEVVGFTALGLGILTKPPKRYTPAERRLYTATSTPLDALLNQLSGRSKMLKNDIETEQKEFLLETLDGLYPDAYYEEDLAIKKEDIKAFHYFIVEDPKFVETIKANDITAATFLIIELAIKFNAVKEE